MMCLALAVGGVAVAACDGSGSDRAMDNAPAVPEKVGDVGGFKTPESIRYDASRDVWFVSNVNGVPSDKDGNGYITRISGDRTRVDTMFVTGSANGVTLHAPKGLAIAGDTLWVTDIDALRAFDANTGAPLGGVDLRPNGAVFLNDIAVGPDGALYVTDSGIQITATGMTHPGPDRVFRVAGGSGAVTDALTFSHAEGPNGITYDAERGRFLIAPSGSGTVFAWTVGASTADSLTSGPGGYDGIAVLADGRALVSSWTDSTLHVLDGATLSAFVRGVPSPADIGIDTLRGLVAIPLSDLGRVEFWTIPAR